MHLRGYRKCIPKLTIPLNYNGQMAYSSPWDSNYHPLPKLSHLWLTPTTTLKTTKHFHTFGFSDCLTTKLYISSLQSIPSADCRSCLFPMTCRVRLSHSTTIWLVSIATTAWTWRWLVPVDHVIAFLKKPSCSIRNFWRVAIVRSKVHSGEMTLGC